MYNAPPPNLMHGINLVQSGHKAEALAYLRHAARNEMMTADAWLWLATATDDREEYRYCVTQALQLDPAHPVAQRMQAELEQQDRALGPAAMGPEYAPGAAARPRRRSGLLIALLAVLVCVGAIVALVASGVLEDQISEQLGGGTATDMQTFTVGARPGFRFRVDLPASWLPADTEREAWRDARGDLADAIEGSDDLWEQVETPFSAATRDPVYGAVLPNVRLVETDADRIERQGMVAALTLQEIVPLPEVPGGEEPTTCNQMRALEAAFRADGALQGEIVDSAVARRSSDADCVFYFHRREAVEDAADVPLALDAENPPEFVHRVQIAVPVQPARYAFWVLTFGDEARDDYDNVIDRIIRTLQAVPAGEGQPAAG
ncbi:MAG: hypothetical protein GXY36_05105 [Chloroflexi bacterium]|nr:hypothetical protein [Chloroflexota bacterium]